jgi:hypothetical protein
MIDAIGNVSSFGRFLSRNEPSSVDRASTVAGAPKPSAQTG